MSVHLKFKFSPFCKWKPQISKYSTEIRARSSCGKVERKRHVNQGLYPLSAPKKISSAGVPQEPRGKTATADRGLLLNTRDLLQFGAVMGTWGLPWVELGLKKLFPACCFFKIQSFFHS